MLGRHIMEVQLQSDQAATTCFWMPRRPAVHPICVCLELLARRVTQEPAAFVQTPELATESPHFDPLRQVRLDGTEQILHQLGGVYNHSMAVSIPCFEHLSTAPDIQQRWGEAFLIDRSDQLLSVGSQGAQMWARKYLALLWGQHVVHQSGKAAVTGTVL